MDPDSGNKLSGAMPAMIAQAVADELKPILARKHPSREIVVERSYGEWDLDISHKANRFEVGGPEGGATRVDVVPHTTSSLIQLATKGRLGHEFAVDVAVRKNLAYEADRDAYDGRLDIEEIDALVEVTQDCWFALCGGRPSATPEFVWVSTAIEVCPWREHLRLMRQFTSIVRTVYRMDVLLDDDDRFSIPNGTD